MSSPISQTVSTCPNSPNSIVVPKRPTIVREQNLFDLEFANRVNKQDSPAHIMHSPLSNQPTRTTSEMDVIILALNAISFSSVKQPSTPPRSTNMWIPVSHKKKTKGIHVTGSGSSSRVDPQMESEIRRQNQEIIARRREIVDEVHMHREAEEKRRLSRANRDNFLTDLAHQLEIPVDKVRQIRDIYMNANPVPIQFGTTSIAHPVPRMTIESAQQLVSNLECATKRHDMPYPHIGNRENSTPIPVPGPSNSYAATAKAGM